MSSNAKPRRRGRKILKRVIVTLLLLMILAGAGVYGYFTMKDEYRVTYDTYSATTGSISNTLSFSGTMQLIDSATYTASQGGTVRAVYVAIGDKVKKGDKLVRLSTGETIEAEFDGTINTLEVVKGDKVKAGETLVQVADFEHMQVSTRVDEYDIADVHVGDACTVTVTANGKTFKSEIAKIDRISASGGNVASYPTTVYVDVNGTDDVYAGMAVTVTVTQQEATNVVVLKVDALSFDERNSAFVYQMAEDGTMKQKPVTVGVSNGNYVEIKEGLTDGETVYVVAKKVTTSSFSNMMSGMFGSTSINQQRRNKQWGNGGGGTQNRMPNGGSR